MNDEKVLFGEEFEEEIDFGGLDEDNESLPNEDSISAEDASEYSFSDREDEEEASDSTYEISYEEFGISEDDDENEISEIDEDEYDSEEAAEDDKEDEDSYEDENDTVAMVSRNSERVQTGKSAVHKISGQEREITFEQPVREAPPTAPRPQPIRPEASRKETISRPAIKTSEKKSSRIVVINTVVSVVTLCAVGFGLFSGMRRTKELEKLLEEKTEEIESLRENTDKEEIREVASIFDDDRTVSEEIETEKEKILFWDDTVGYSWTPVLSGLKQNNYKDENFSINNRGHMEYTVNGDSSSYFGIDVSSYQGDIDWQSAREDGVEFAILRIGFRGYGEEGKIRLDETFIKNYEGAHEAGIDVGVYFFSQATSVDEAIEEAHFVLDNLEGRRLEYPVVFDWETVETMSEDDIPRTEDVMPNTLTLSAIAFCETVQSEGYDAMIYTNKKQAAIKYDMRQLANYPVWLAYYDTKLNYCYDFDIWQYGTGYIDGIEGEVDFNIAMIK